MGYAILEHTADLRVELVAETRDGLFGEGVAVMFDWSQPRLSGALIEREVSLAAADPVELLVDFLNEVLTLSQIYREAYQEVEVLECTATSVRARLLGRSCSGSADEIKAVTYHGAQLAEVAGGGWRAELVMDI